jgi:hypothetical protein
MSGIDLNPSQNELVSCPGNSRWNNRSIVTHWGAFVVHTKYKYNRSFASLRMTIGF